MTNTYKKVSYHKQIARQHFCHKNATFRPCPLDGAWLTLELRLSPTCITLPYVVVIDQTI